jgi:hypothetical protein
MVRSESINVRLTPTEAVMVRKVAAAEGQTVSEYIRACIITVRGLEGDPVAWDVIKGNIRQALKGLFPAEPTGRKKLA